jgi:hypothetical protein
VLDGAVMLEHNFQVLQEHSGGSFCTVLEDIGKPRFERVELVYRNDVISSGTCCGSLARASSAAGRLQSSML